ncbi:hypothetical protein NDU88_001956 [Pleurodeles waltl]|uniref:Uncharacterized protein n=1 Tax=Pleurodeles waltl TaxID=8319 RepID=A0AAV7NE27_PLEWA|nr:hypothetical protein NDU88_001956 [Pleurodeles waltl]
MVLPHPGVKIEGRSGQPLSYSTGLGEGTRTVPTSGLALLQILLSDQEEAKERGPTRTQEKSQRTLHLGKRGKPLIPPPITETER